MDRQRRTDLHESAHSVVADTCGWTLSTVTVTSGSALAGCAKFKPPKVPDSMITTDLCTRPFMLWPPPLRERFESAVLIPMAGSLAALLLGPAAEGRAGDPVAERVTDRVEELIETLPPPAEADLEWAAGIVDNPDSESDDEKVARTIWAAFGSDLASASRFAEYAEAQCRSLIWAQRTVIERLADVLGEVGVLSGQAAQEVIHRAAD